MDIDYYEKFFFAFEKLYELLKMYVGYDSDEPFAMTLFGLINNKAMFLHSGRSDKGNNENLYGIFQLFNSLVELSKNGAKIIDFEGVNSPKNSFSKLKFGGTIHPYYILILKIIKLMSFDNQWENQIYKKGKQINSYPFDEVVSDVNRMFRDLNVSNFKALDLGCGTGNNSKFLLDYGFGNVIGIDGSKSAIKIAEINIKVKSANF